MAPSSNSSKQQGRKESRPPGTIIIPQDKPQPELMKRYLEYQRSRKAGQTPSYFPSNEKVKMEPLVKMEQSLETSTTDCEIIEDRETIRGLQGCPKKTRQGADLTDSIKQGPNPSTEPAARPETVICAKPDPKKKKILGGTLILPLPKQQQITMPLSAEEANKQLTSLRDKVHFLNRCLEEREKPTESDGRPAAKKAKRAADYYTIDGLGKKVDQLTAKNDSLESDKLQADQKLKGLQNKNTNDKLLAEQKFKNLQMENMKLKQSLRELGVKIDV